MFYLYANLKYQGKLNKNKLNLIHFCKNFLMLIITMYLSELLVFWQQRKERDTIGETPDVHVVSRAETKNNH